MNVGWDARDPDSKYVAFVNNNLIATSESLVKLTLTESIEGEEKVAAVSGLIYYPDGKPISSAGGWIDELWVAGTICNGLTINNCPEVNKEHYITYPDGAYMIVRVSAISKVLKLRHTLK